MAENAAEKVKIKLEEDIKEEIDSVRCDTFEESLRNTIKAEGEEDTDMLSQKRSSTPVKDEHSPFSSPNAASRARSMSFLIPDQSPSSLPPSDSPEDLNLAITGYLSKLRPLTEPDSEFHRTGSDLSRKAMLHFYFSKYSAFETCVQFSAAMKHEWQTVMVQLVNWRHQNLRRQYFRDVGPRDTYYPRGVKKHPGAVNTNIMGKRSGWFERREGGEKEE